MKKVIFLFSLLAFASVTVCAAPNARKSAPAAQKTASSNKIARSTAGKKTTSTVSDSSRQKKAAEAEQQKLHRQLNTLKKEIGKTEKAKGKAADELAQSQRAIDETERSLAELAQQKTQTEARLAELAAEQNQLNAVVSRQQAQLAKIMRKQYASGSEDRMKLLFSGEDPNRINRDLQYVNYLSSAYSRLIDQLRGNLTAVREKRAEADQARQDLEKIVARTNQQRSLLEKEKAEHAALLAQLSQKLDSQKKEAERLAQDERRLASLVTRLTQAIEAQRRAAEKQEAERRLQAERNARKQAAGAKQANRSQSVPRETEKISPAPYRPDTASAFGRMRGSLRMPVSGTVTARYGMRRAEGPSWKGIFIRTSSGAPIHAVAAGRVVFANYLGAFGNLIIVDHGNQYMTIYGSAQSFAKRVGDNVSAGETIANAGSSGENTEIGLYFEIRHNGRAENPLDWIR